MVSLQVLIDPEQVRNLATSWADVFKCIVYILFFLLELSVDLLQILLYLLHIVKALFKFVPLLEIVSGFVRSWVLKALLEGSDHLVHQHWELVHHFFVFSKVFFNIFVQNCGFTKQFLLFLALTNQVVYLIDHVLFCWYDLVSKSIIVLLSFVE